MLGHGAVGRTFHGRILQLITGSTGLDDWEWGVTLFGVASRRPEGVRLRDALRRGVGPLRRVRPLLDRAWWPRSRTCSTVSLAPVRHAAVAVGPTRRRREKLDASAGRDSRGWAASWWPSAAGPTPPSWPGWPPTSSGPTACCASPPSRRRWPPRSSPTAGRLAGEWGLRWREVRHRRDRRPRLRGQRRRPLLPLQGEPSRRPGPAGRGRGGHRRPRREPRRPRRPPAGPARRGRSAARASRWWRPASPRPTSARCRAASGLRTWDKPAAACLASRVPYGTPVTLGTLDDGGRRPSRRCGRSGSGQLRVRHYGDLARIELDGDDLAAAVRAAGRRWWRPCAAAGYRYVTLDLEGFRSGNLNRAPGADAGRRSGDTEERHDRRPGEAHLPRGPGARAASSPGSSATTTWSPTSGGPTSTSTRVDRVRARGRAGQDRRAPWPGCATQGVRVDLLGDVVES